ncbi:MAG TPA: Gfo/Idh/MocA family oxidoreductase, partial [Verrucomicrobiota bacterium]|nr:Gfo/Idh/MocA family oxidoreductase [Verrucomicrobiota bacterium]
AEKIISSKPNLKQPEKVKDVRKVLEDKSVDALFIAAPNHWHATAAILGCSAGKHIYVEKPSSQNPREGELLVAASKKYKRIVQMGNQRRSWMALIEMVEKLKSGAIGKVLTARSYYTNARGSIGVGKTVPVPQELDYSLWQGPAPERPYVDNLVHYNWHWRWHWGNGELGNNGIHALDVARWGMGVDLPIRITYGGGRYHFKDDQETPDTGVATFDFGSCFITWEHSSCHPRSAEKLPFVSFFGTEGTMINDGNGYKLYDAKGALVEQKTGEGGDKVHIMNFLDCIRTGKKPNSDVEDCQKSTLMCHLGNIAWRLGRTIDFSPEKRTILNDKEAMQYWSREYRKGWEPIV